MTEKFILRAVGALFLIGIGMSTAFVLPAVASTFADIPSAGGPITIHATTAGSSDCSWSSKPLVHGFDTQLPCQPAMSRVVRLPVNRSTSTRRYVFSLAASGPTGPVVVEAVVIQAGTQGNSRATHTHLVESSGS
jgi:hypothetical protein